MNTQKKKPTAMIAPVVVRLPKKLIADLDKVAVKNCRSRSSEVRSRLMQSFEMAARS